MDNEERVKFVLEVIEAHDDNLVVAARIVDRWETDIEDERRKLMPDC